MKNRFGFYYRRLGGKLDMFCKTKFKNRFGSDKGGFLEEFDRFDTADISVDLVQIRVGMVESRIRLVKVV